MTTFVFVTGHGLIGMTWTCCYIHNMLKSKTKSKEKNPNTSLVYAIIVFEIYSFFMHSAYFKCHKFVFYLSLNLAIRILKYLPP